MNKDTYPHQSLIKQDIEEIVGRVVGEIVSTALQLIANQFDEIHKVMATKADIVRLEKKLDATVEVVSDHSKQLSQLKIRLA